MDATISELLISIETDAQSSINSIGSLTTALSGLRSVTKGTFGGIQSLANNLNTLNGALNSFSAKTQSLKAVTDCITTLSKFKDVKISSSVGTSLTQIADALGKLNGEQIDRLSIIGTALNGLNGVKVSSTVPKNIAAVGEAVAKINQSDIEKLKEIANAMDKLGVASTNMARISSSSLNLSGLGRQLDNNQLGLIKNSTAMKLLGGAASIVKGQITGFANAIGYSVVKTAVFAKGLISAVMGLKDLAIRAFDASNSYVENLNLFQVAMGDSFESARDFAQQVEDLMGIDMSEWMKNQGIFQTLITGFGVASDRAAVMSQNLTQLGYDLSSFFNIDFASAMQKLQSGISGELEPLRRLGFDLSRSKLVSVAKDLGITDNFDQMDQAQKAQLRYYAILTQVTTAQGDMKRTLSSSANQARILSSQVNILARSVGNILVPALNIALPALITVTKAVRAFADMIASLMGFELPEFDYSDLDKLGGVTDGVEDNLESAAGSAKKLKSYLLSIDELNVLEPNKDGGSGGGADVGTDGWDFELPTYDFLGQTEERFSRLSNLIKEITRLIGVFHDDTDKLGKSIGYVFNSYIDGINAIGMGSTLGDKLTEIFQFSDSFFTTFDGTEIGNKIAEFFNGIWEHTDTNLAASALAKAVNSVIDSAVGIVDTTEWNLIGEKISGFIVSGMTNLELAKFISGTSNLITNLQSMIITAVDKTDWDIVGKQIGDALAAADWYKILVGGGTLAIKITDAALTLITSVLKSLVEGDAFTQIADGVFDVIASIAEWLVQPDTVKLIGEAFINLFVAALQLMSGALFGDSKIIQAFSGSLGKPNVSSSRTNGASSADGASSASGANTQSGNEWYRNLISFGANTGLTALGFGGVKPGLDFWGDRIEDIINLSNGASFGNVFIGRTAEAYQNVREQIDSVTHLPETIVDGVESVVDFFADLFSDKNAGPLNRGLQETNNQLRKMTTTKIGDVLEEQFGIATDALDVLAEGFVDLDDTLEWTASFSSAKFASGMKRGLETTTEYVEAFIPQYSGIIKNSLNETADYIEVDFAPKMSRNMRDALSGMANIGVSFDGLKQSIVRPFEEAVDSVRNTLNGIPTHIRDVVTPNTLNAFRALSDGAKGITIQPRIAMPSYELKFEDTLNAGAKKKMEQLGLPTQLPKLSVKNWEYYANGGFPSMGSAFIAGESGAELVGNINGRTGVVAGDQIVEAVALGVAQGFMAANNGDNGGSYDVNVTVELDGEKIYSNQQKVAKRRGYDTGSGDFVYAR